MIIKIFDDADRQTGRTTRMIEKAIIKAQEGRAVYVLVANEKERERISKLFGSDNPYNNQYGIKVETENSFGNFRWETLSLLGAHPNCIVFVDHYAIECEVAKRLRGMEKAISLLSTLIH